MTDTTTEITLETAWDDFTPDGRQFVANTFQKILDLYNELGEQDYMSGMGIFRLDLARITMATLDEHPHLIDEKRHIFLTKGDLIYHLIQRWRKASPTKIKKKEGDKVMSVWLGLNFKE
jgi:hypothetical protein